MDKPVAVAHSGTTRKAPATPATPSSRSPDSRSIYSPEASAGRGRPEEEGALLHTVWRRPDRPRCRKTRIHCRSPPWLAVHWRVAHARMMVVFVCARDGGVCDGGAMVGQAVQPGSFASLGERVDRCAAEGLLSDTQARLPPLCLVRGRPSSAPSTPQLRARY